MFQQLSKLGHIKISPPDSSGWKTWVRIGLADKDMFFFLLPRICKPVLLKNYFLVLTVRLSIITSYEVYDTYRFMYMFNCFKFI